MQTALPVSPRLAITVFTLFPHWFGGPMADSILGRARESGLLGLETVNIRDFAADRHRTVDAPPYGGGGGMVLRPDIVAAAMDATIGPPGTAGRPWVVHLSPRGRPFRQAEARRLARLPALALLCGHYEAIDQRLLDTRVDEEISLGDFVLTGGEIPAMALIDAVARLVPGVLGNDASTIEESFSAGLLEGPHYTRPEEFEGLAVPAVLRSGDHGAVARWREEQGLALTADRRPDMVAALLLHPDQIRRLARRRRPFAVWRAAAGRVEVLAASPAAAALAGLSALLERARWEAGLVPGVRLTELRVDGALLDPEPAAALAAHARALVEAGARGFWERVLAELSALQPSATDPESA
jgi:tRNA (guanine37-N1)-methyltransferase